MGKYLAQTAIASVLIAGAGCGPRPAPDGDVTTNTVAASPTTHVLNALASAGLNANEATNTGVQNTWQKTKDAGSNAGGETKNVATNAWQATKEAGSNVVEKTGDLTVHVWNQARQALNATATNEVSTNYFAYDFSMKDSFVSEAQTNLDYLDGQINVLNDKFKNSTSTNSDLQEAMQMVNEKRSALTDKYNAVKGATPENWNDAKSAYVKTYYDTSATLKATTDELAVKQ